jgi:hypothetical protein
MEMPPFPIVSRRFLPLIGVWAATWVLSGCLFGDDKKSDPCSDRDKVDNSSTIDLELNFSHLLDSLPLELDTMTYQNKAGNQYGVSDLRYSVSGFRFYDMEDKEVFYKDTALYVDIRDSSTLRQIIAGVPQSHLHSFAFTFGIDPCLNVDGALPPTRDWLNFAWPFGGGYHFMQLEGFFINSGGSQAAYAAHAGTRRSPAQGVDQKNHFEVGPTIQHATPVPNTRIRIEVTMEISRWFDGPKEYDFNVFGEAVMNDADAQDAMRENGAAGVFTIGKGEIVPKSPTPVLHQTSALQPRPPA